MNKKNTPYSAPCDLQLAFLSYFRYLGVLPDGTVSYAFHDSKNWEPVKIVEGSLTINTLSERPDPGFLFTSDVAFRVSFAEPENRARLNYYQTEPLIAKIQTAGKQQLIIGSQLYPCILHVSQPTGWDGYECVLYCSDLRLPVHPV